MVPGQGEEEREGMGQEGVRPYPDAMTENKSEDTPRKTADDGNKTQRQEGDGLGQKPTQEPKRSRAADSPYAS